MDDDKVIHDLVMAAAIHYANTTNQNLINDGKPPLSGEDYVYYLVRGYKDLYQTVVNQYKD